MQYHIERVVLPVLHLYTTKL